MRTKTDIALPEPARIDFDCSGARLDYFTPDQLRAAVEADRRERMHDNAGCISKLAESDKQDHCSGATKKVRDHVDGVRHMVPGDEEIEAMAEDAGVWVPMGSGPEKECSLQALRSLITAALSRYSSGQPTSCDCDDKSQCWEPCGDLGHDAEHAKLSSGRPAASAEPSGYAYRYPDGIRFNDGREVNGCKPAETVPYWFGAAPVAQEPVIKEETSHEN